MNQTNLNKWTQALGLVISFIRGIVNVKSGRIMKGIVTSDVVSEVVGVTAQVFPYFSAL